MVLVLVFCLGLSDLMWELELIVWVDLVQLLVFEIFPLLSACVCNGAVLSSRL